MDALRHGPRKDNVKYGLPTATDQEVRRWVLVHAPQFWRLSLKADGRTLNFVGFLM